MSYLSADQLKTFGDLLRTFFSLPYSTDLDGKDAETLIRIVKNVTGLRSKRKELFDIIDGTTGYSVKTLFKLPSAVRVDLQEQRFCDVEEVRKIRVNADSCAEQGAILLSYMSNRIKAQMQQRNIKEARSLILLKHWDTNRENFTFRYWEEDFVGYVNDLVERNNRGEIEWVGQDAGLHGRDRDRIKLTKPRKSGAAANDENVRLLRMHYKHNQIFTDHDIPPDAQKISFNVTPWTWDELSTRLRNL